MINKTEDIMRKVDEGLAGLRLMALAQAKQAASNGQSNELAKQIAQIVALLQAGELELAKTAMAMSVHNVN